MDDKLLQILENSACLSKGQLTGYLKHTLYPEELRAVELHLSSCALCNDAVEGMEMQQNIDALIASMTPPALPAAAPKEKPKEKKEIPVATKTEKQELPVSAVRNTHQPVTDAGNKNDTTNFAFRPRKSWARPMGIAAGLLIAFGLLWYFEFNRDNSKEHIAQQMEQSEDPAAKNKAANPVALQSTAPVQDSSAILAAKKHTDSILIARREEQKKKARKDSMIALAAIGDSGKSIAAESPAIAASKVAEAEQDNNQDEISAKKMAAAPAKAKEETKKELSDFELGMRKYREKNYASALLYFKSAESDKSDPKHWDAVYYSGLCNRNLNKDRKARKLFERVVDAGAPQKKSAQKQLDDMKKGD